MKAVSLRSLCMAGLGGPWPAAAQLPFTMRPSRVRPPVLPSSLSSSAEDGNPCRSPLLAAGPVVLRQPGEERIPLFPLRPFGQPARPLGRRHAPAAVSSRH
jgi:hypothetical protein